MPNQQVEPAVLAKLSSISSTLISRKLRVAGWLLDDDISSSIIMIYDGEDALLVDVSLCLNPRRAAPWLRESKSVVMALGYLEFSQDPLPLPVLHAHAPLVNANPHLVLRAIVVEEARGLDMMLWNRAIEAREEVQGTQKIMSHARQSDQHEYRQRQLQSQPSMRTHEE